jgi:hypothetical protein
MIGAVVEVHYHPLKLNRSTAYFKRKRPESFIVVHNDPVVIVSAIDIRLTEFLPLPFVVSAPLRCRDHAQAEQHQ